MIRTYLSFGRVNFFPSLEQLVTWSLGTMEVTAPSPFFTAASPHAKAGTGQAGFVARGGRRSTPPGRVTGPPGRAVRVGPGGRSSTLAVPRARRLPRRPVPVRRPGSDSVGVTVRHGPGIQLGKPEQLETWTRMAE